MVHPVQFISLDRPSLPIIHECDVAIVGGSFGGVSAALALARRGLKVAVIEPRTYLGREVTATLRPWLPHSLLGQRLPQAVDACLQYASAPARGGEIPLQMDKVKTLLEDLLLEQGVFLLYATAALGVDRADDGRLGLIVANKSGRQVVACRTVVDATLFALVACERHEWSESEPGLRSTYSANA